MSKEDVNLTDNTIEFFNNIGTAISDFFVTTTLYNDPVRFILYLGIGWIVLVVVFSFLSNIEDTFKKTGLYRLYRKYFPAPERDPRLKIDEDTGIEYIDDEEEKY